MGINTSRVNFEKQSSRVLLVGYTIILTKTFVMYKELAKILEVAIIFVTFVACNNGTLSCACLSWPKLLVLFQGKKCVSFCFVSLRSLEHSQRKQIKIGFCFTESTLYTKA